MELDPSSQHESALTLCRHLGLGKRYSEMDEMLAKLDVAHSRRSGPVRMLHLRLALWEGRTDALEALSRVQVGTSIREASLGLLTGYALKRVTADELEASVGRATRSVNKRFTCLVQQYIADLHGFRGDWDRCLRELRLAVGRGLTDVDWLDRSPCLVGAREAKEWEELRREVDARAALVRLPSATSTLL